MNTDEFIAWAKRTITERAQYMALKYDPADIVHAHEMGHDIVWLRSIIEPVLDLETGEMVEEKKPILWYEIPTPNLNSFDTTQQEDGVVFIVTLISTRVRCIMPLMVIMRLPDGSIRESGDNCMELLEELGHQATTLGLSHQLDKVLFRNLNRGIHDPQG